MIDLLKHACLLILISGFTGTFAFSLGFVLISISQSSEDSRSEGQ